MAGCGPPRTSDSDRAAASEWGRSGIVARNRRFGYTGAEAIQSSQTRSFVLKAWDQETRESGRLLCLR
jgi:hypothetical protein